MEAGRASGGEREVAALVGREAKEGGGGGGGDLSSFVKTSNWTSAGLEEIEVVDATVIGTVTALAS